MKLYNILNSEGLTLKFQIEFILEEKSDIHLLERIAQMMYMEYCIGTTVDLAQHNLEPQKRYLMTFDCNLD